MTADYLCVRYDMKKDSSKKNSSIKTNPKGTSFIFLDLATLILSQQLETVSRYRRTDVHF